MTQSQKLSQLRKEVKDFLEKRAAELGLETVRYKGTISVIQLPHGRLVDRPLTETEWGRVRRAVAHYEDLRIILEYFEKNQNQPVSGQDLVNTGVLDQRSVENFNRLLGMHNTRCTLDTLSKWTRGTDWYQRSYCIYPLT
jgi:hypothetical protein